MSSIFSDKDLAKFTPFERFFADVFPKMLDTIQTENGLFSDGTSINRASWDRKAALLIWRMMDRPDGKFVPGSWPAYNTRITAKVETGPAIPAKEQDDDAFDIL